MRVSYDWLKTMIDIPEDPKTLSDEFIRTGTEVEAIDTVGESFDHVVTAKVLTKTPHPDSDHMYVCSVDVGDKNLDADGNPAPLQIVCGAQNFEGTLIKYIFGRLRWRSKSTRRFAPTRKLSTSA